LVLILLFVCRDAGIDRDVHSRGLREGSQKRPFLNKEEASPRVLILPGQFSPIPVPVFETWALGFDEVGQS
jgi:hypothetical protein